MIPIPAGKLSSRVPDQVPAPRTPGPLSHAQVAATPPSPGRHDPPPKPRSPPPLATARARGARTHTMNARIGPVMPNIASKFP
jgi:hypothetical protein